MADGQRCMYCGAPIEAGDRVCRDCGKPVPARDFRAVPALTPSESAPPQRYPGWKEGVEIVDSIAFIVWILLTLVALLIGAFHDDDSGSSDQPAVVERIVDGVVLMLWAEGDTAGRCAGDEEVRAGVPVVLLNESGTPIAEAVLGPGFDASPGPCEFVFQMTGVPDAETYTFRVGERHTPAVPRTQMADDFNWRVLLVVSEPPVPAAGHFLPLE